MSSVISVLEGLGQGSERLGDAGTAMAISTIAADQRDALLAADAEALRRLIAVRPSMACLIMAPDDESAPAEQPVEPGDSPDESDSQAA